MGKIHIIPLEQLWDFLSLYQMNQKLSQVSVIYLRNFRVISLSQGQRQIFLIGQSRGYFFSMLYSRYESEYQPHISENDGRISQIRSFVLFQKKEKGLFLFSGAILLYQKNYSSIAQSIILLLHLTHHLSPLIMDFLDQSHSLERIYISKVMENLRYSGEERNSVCIFPSFADNEYILIFFYEKIYSSLVESCNPCYHTWNSSCSLYCRIFLFHSLIISSCF